MENQINSLEQRLIHREQELKGAIEESKAAAKMERSRLIAIHTQVCMLMLMILNWDDDDDDDDDDDNNDDFISSLRCTIISEHVFIQEWMHT